MEKQQKKIENIYYDKYLKKNTIQERIKSKLRDLEKKMDKLDVGLGQLKDVEKLGQRLLEDFKKTEKEKWNDLSLEMIMKKEGTSACTF
jgi:peptidyl-tRNA hydrolase